MSHLETCYHCGLPTPQRKQAFTVEIFGKDQIMCCPGCQAVAEAIVNANLVSYYKNRSDVAINPQDLSQVLPDELKLYDQKDIKDTFINTLQSESCETSLLIEGISCAACGWLIEKHLHATPGVISAQLNLSTHKLHITWNEQQLDLSTILLELRRIGYVGHLWKPDIAATQLAKENRRAMRELGVAGILWMQVMMASMATWPEFNIDLSDNLANILRWVSFFMTTPIVFYCCGQFFRGALRDIRTRHLTMDISISLAIGGAYLAGIWSTIHQTGDLYFDAVGMFALFLLTGRYLERRAREKTALATSQLVKLLPASCLKILEDKNTQRVLLTDLKIGDCVSILPGELLPADGILKEGNAHIDESVLTGEYLPKKNTVGDKLTAGTLNVESPIVVEITALGDATKLSSIIRLLERAQSDKPRIAQIADIASQWFLALALLSAVIVGLIWLNIDASRACWVVLSLLVATCPCALSLATPAALTAATGMLHGQGLLITRGHVLEGLNKIDTIIFDKTGTLTEGRLALSEIHVLGGMTKDQCLSLAASLESHSEHPISKAFGNTGVQIDSVINTPARGLQGVYKNSFLRIGQPDYVCELSKTPTLTIPGISGQWLLLGNEIEPLAWFVLDDQLRADAQELIADCRKRHWNIMLFTGDTSPMVKTVAKQLGITQVYDGMTPHDKLIQLQNLHTKGHKILMVGDGVNDVPVLAGADISVAMGTATDLAKTAADAILLSNKLKSLIKAFNLAKRTRHIIIQNLIWAALYNSLVLPFAALGWITPLWAAVGMSISSLLVILNALRLARA